MLTIICNLKELEVAKKCSWCKEKNELIIKTPIYSFCSFECASNKANEQTLKRVRKENKKVKQVAAKEVKAFNKETKRLKETIKKRTGKNGHYDNHKTVLHKYIKHVLLKGEPCYTCGLKQRFGDSPQAFHVGHFIPQKQVDPRRFMLMNLRIQCYKCNTHNSGMRAEYRQRLIEEIGLDKVEWLECDVNHKSLKEQFPEVSDIKNATSQYRAMIKAND